MEASSKTDVDLPDISCPRLTSIIGRQFGVGIEEVDSLQLELEAMMTKAMERKNCLHELLHTLSNTDASSMDPFQSNRKTRSQQQSKAAREYSRRPKIPKTETQVLPEIPESLHGKQSWVDRSSSTTSSMAAKLPAPKTQLQRRQNSRSSMIETLKKNYVFLQANPVLERFWPQVRHSWLQSLHDNTATEEKYAVDEVLQLSSLRSMKRSTFGALFFSAGAGGGCVYLPETVKNSLQIFANGKLNSQNNSKGITFGGISSFRDNLISDFTDSKISPQKLRWSRSTKGLAERALAKLTIVDQRMFMHLDKPCPRRSDFTRDCKERNKVFAVIDKIPGLQGFTFKLDRAEAKRSSVSRVVAAQHPPKRIGRPPKLEQEEQLD